MTREQKLALIIGFSVFMVVGVLVGDYFSKARAARIDGGLAMTTEQQPRVPEPAFTAAPESDHGAGTSSPVRELPVEPHQIVNGERASGDFIDNPTPPGVSIDETPRPQDPPAPTPPATNTRPYKVRDGDSLYKIAQRECGDGKLAPKLAELNKQTLKGTDTIRVGMTLQLPVKETKLATSPSNAPESAAKKPRTPDLRTSPINPDKPEIVKVSYRTYRVQKGDTFMKIAAAQLGKSSRFEEIAKLNKGVKSENLREGMELLLPAK